MIGEKLIVGVVVGGLIDCQPLLLFNCTAVKRLEVFIDAYKNL